MNWNVLAFLTDAVWWLIVLADRMYINMEEAMGGFLNKTEQMLKK